MLRSMGMESTKPTKSSKDIAILVVDDDAMLLRMNQIVLDDLGYRVQLAASGTEALDRIGENQGAFDLVVLDQRLPDREGLSVMREAKQLYPDLRFMLVTGYAAEDVVAEMLAAGAVRVLDKPYDIDQFADAVKNAIESGG